MATYYLNGTPLVEGANITLNGFTYPYSWLESTSPSLRASYGIEKTGDVNYDPRYYWDKDMPKDLEDLEAVDADGNPAYIKVFDPSIGERGEMVDSDKRLIVKGLKTSCLSEIKYITNNLLSPTDFYIIRNSIEALQIPESVSAYRAAVVEESARLQDAIPAATTVQELIAVMNSAAWPKVE